MAFIPLLSGEAYPRGKHYKSITLMSYINKHKKVLPKGLPARKYCYIIKCGDLQKVFTAADITLRGESENKMSFWNRNHPIEGEEYGVEICEDDNGKPNTYLDPWYLVYRKHWMRGHAEAQITEYAGSITPDEAVKLDEQLRNYDISRHSNDTKK